MISELAKSSTIINIDNTRFNDAERKKEQYSQTSTCGLIEKTGSSQFEEANSSNKDEYVDPQSCGVHVMNCRGNGDCLNKESQSCTDTTRSTTDQYYDKDCSECRIIRRDPTPTELTMCLHALSYKVSEILQAHLHGLKNALADTVICDRSVHRQQ